MTDLPTQSPAGEESAPYAAPPFASAPMAPPSVAAGAVERVPFSKLAIAGFVISCVSIFVLGFAGVIGVGLASRGFRDTRNGVARGRGLAIAGMIIGTVGFVFYVLMFIIRAKF